MSSSLSPIVVDLDEGSCISCNVFTSNASTAYAISALDLDRLAGVYGISSLSALFFPGAELEMPFANADVVVEIVGLGTDWVTVDVEGLSCTEGVSSTSVTGVKLLSVGLLLTLL